MNVLPFKNSGDATAGEHSLSGVSGSLEVSGIVGMHMARENTHHVTRTVGLPNEKFALLFWPYLGLPDLHFCWHAPNCAAACSGVSSNQFWCARLQVLETMRTLFVWVGGLALYYCSATGKIGERWDNYSYFQVSFSYIPLLLSPTDHIGHKLCMPHSPTSTSCSQCHQ
jgi:hypothetical protein